MPTMLVIPCMMLVKYGIFGGIMQIVSTQLGTVMFIINDISGISISLGHVYNNEISDVSTELASVMFITMIL